MAETADPATASRAIEAVGAVNPGAKEFALKFVHPDFLEGALYVVGFAENAEPRENYAYVTRNEVYVAKNTSHLVELVARRGRRATAFQLFMEVGGIAGIIAVLITITICYIYGWGGGREVPAVLSSALATILGFYFGTKTTGRTRESV